MFKLAKYLKPYRTKAIIGPIFKLIEAIFELIVPIVMKMIIDEGIDGGKGQGYILKMGGVLVLLSVVGLCSSLVCQTLASIVSQGYGTIVRNELFKHIESFTHREMDQFGSATLITRITNDVNQLQVAVAMLIRLVVRAPFLVIGATIMAATIHLKLSIIFLLTAIVLSIVIYFIMSRSVPYYKKVQQELDTATTITRENLTGTRVIRAFSRQNKEESRFNEACSSLNKASIQVGKISSLLNPFTYMIVNIGILCLLWFGGNQVANNQGLTKGDIVALVNYMSQILLALLVLANLVVIFTKASASAHRVNEIFDTVPSLIDGTEKELKENHQPIIEFKNVSFSYNKTKLVLEHINFKIERGQTIGIIGATGSGKSTLVELLSRFYDVSEGEILIYGKNVKEIQNEYLRQIIGIVPQKAVLFHGTIEENLRWRKIDATKEELWQALKIAQAEEFVRKNPLGLQEEIVAGGKNLSGGQKQRLTIARALVGNPKILILDDSSSALDFATDASLRKALKDSLRNITVIMVSQRATTLKNCDFIVCLDDGKVAGLGTHEELLKTSKVYQQIYQSQFKEEGQHHEK